VLALTVVGVFCESLSVILRDMDIATVYCLLCNRNVHGVVREMVDAILNRLSPSISLPFFAFAIKVSRNPAVERLV